MRHSGFAIGLVFAVTSSGSALAASWCPNSGTPPNPKLVQYGPTVSIAGKSGSEFCVDYPAKYDASKARLWCSISNGDGNGYCNYNDGKCWIGTAL